MMKFNDLLSMSLGNLRRRKLRTFLTVLGVVIGTASIVVMMSLGIGLNKSYTDLISSYGSLTEISIYSDAMYSGTEDGTEPKYMTDDVMEQFRKMDHVASVSPLLSEYVIMKQGAYQANINLLGVTREYMQSIPLKEGTLPDPDSQELKMVVGNKVASQFYNPKSRGGGRYSYSDDDSDVSNVDFINLPMFVIFDTNAYYQSLNGASTDDTTPVKAPKKYLLQTSGLTDGGDSGYNSYSYNVYVDLDLLKSQLKKVFKKGAIPDQPTNKKGKPYNYFIYERAVVEVDGMKNVTAVQKLINGMGFQADSNMEWLEQNQKQSNMIQAALGGIGAVSLFVAAIGIANTMMMSIYERTKEIGIIKVLGCDMGNIRSIFLLESAFIGFIGGVIGIIASYGISFIVNRFLTGMFNTMGDGPLSVIPLWLPLAAIGFAVFVGMTAGFFPARRAMKLSPLAAIRNE